MGELGRNLAVSVDGYFELILSNQNQATALPNQVVVSVHGAGKWEGSVGVESGGTASNEMVLLACRQVGAFDALPVGM